MGYFVHPQGICESTTIGDGTRIWAFAHVLPGAKIGRDVNINDGVFVENDVTIGDRVTVKSGVQVWDGVHLADDVFVGPNVTFTNDPFPRSKQWPEKFSETHIEAGASIGGGAAILPGLTVGRRAMIGAGSIVTKSVPDHAIVVGNPARIVGYVDANDVRTGVDREVPETTIAPPLYALTMASDIRGSLTAVEFDKLPFVPTRFFTVFDVPSKHVRGVHAHRTCEQLLVALAGSVTCLMDDGKEERTYVLDNPGVALHMPAMTWGSQSGYEPGTVLGVFASHAYDSDDYVRDYDEFIELVGK